MKVLIGEFDIFTSFGEEQYFYASLVRANPNVEFHYFTSADNTPPRSPKNATGIQFPNQYSGQYHFGDSTKSAENISEAINFVSNLAFGVTNRTFDVIDLPDRHITGEFLKPALAHHGVKYKSLCLSLHSANKIVTAQEIMQFEAADARYSISRKCIDKWAGLSKSSVRYLDPMELLNIRVEAATKLASTKAVINYFSPEGPKYGKEFFLELIWFLNRGDFEKVSIYGEGPEGKNPEFARMISNRGIRATNETDYDTSSIVSKFSERMINFVPSRNCSFGLLALESVLSGCPTFIDEDAGVLQFLADHFPSVPIPTFNSLDPRLALRSTTEFLEDYDRRRNDLRNAVESVSRNLTGLDLSSIYNTSAAPRSSAFDLVQRRYLDLVDKKESSKSSARWPIQTSINFMGYMIAMVRGKVWNFAARLLKRLAFQGDQFSAKQALLGLRLKNYLQGPKLTLGNLLDLVCRYRIGRVTLFRQLANAEKDAGRSIVWATYQVRIMRWLEQDRFNELAATKLELQRNGFNVDARVLDIMFGGGKESTNRCYEFLRECLAKNRNIETFEYEIFDDRRTKQTFKCGIIVSLYNAAEHLNYFLTDLCEQTMVRTGDCEVILVDSGSTGDERHVFLEFIKEHNVQIVYARSHLRETVQGAWNRGVSISRAHYLTPLGVDEMIKPDALAILSAEMDQDPKLDWISGNTQHTVVDSNGRWNYEGVLYDRSDYHQDICLLDGSYLSYAGSLYRRSIHTRFGYFDSSCKAGGDNEFRFRVLPFIKSKTLAETVAIFRDFPEERVTNHPRAEIEDLRGWYLHRTPAGVRYLFQNRGVDDALKQLQRCFGFRAAGSKKLSTNIDYALNIILFIEASHSADVNDLKKLVLAAQEILRGLELLPARSSMGTALQILRAIRTFHKIGKKIETIFAYAPGTVEMNVFNDNRFEQHFYSW